MGLSDSPSQHSCSHSGEHDHHHGHHHSHGPTKLQKITRAFTIGITLNSFFVITEVIYGNLSGSMALLADASHNLQDVFALAISAFSFWLAKKPASKNWTYGFRRSTILASLLNSLFLILACGGILWESLHRLHHQTNVDGAVMLWVALVGVVINLASALFFSGQKNELNSKAAFIHLITDAMISLAVAISGFVVLKTQVTWIDPVLSMLIAGVILYGTWGLLKDSLSLTLNSVPIDLNIEAVESVILNDPNVLKIETLHAWAISTFENVLTAHLLVDEDTDTNELLHSIEHQLKSQFPIHQTTIQMVKKKDKKLVQFEKIVRVQSYPLHHHCTTCDHAHNLHDPLF